MGSGRLHESEGGAGAIHRVSVFFLRKPYFRNREDDHSTGLIRLFTLSLASWQIGWMNCDMEMCA